MFTNIKLHDLVINHNVYNHALYPPCAFCGSKAYYALSRTSLESGYTYHDVICKSCAKNWKPS